MTQTRRAFLAQLGRGALCGGPLLLLGCGSDEATRRKPKQPITIVHTSHSRQPPPPDRIWRSPAPPFDAVPPAGERLEWTEARWRDVLKPRPFHILREAGTEPAWLGEHNYNEAVGTYHCGGCNAPLFASSAKYHSGTGWPSFSRSIDPKRVVERPDRRYNMARVEVLCARCGGHHGHIFDDPRSSTGRRYCVNSVALFFRAGAQPTITPATDRQGAAGA